MLGLCALLAACSLAPAQQRPALPTAAAFPSAGPAPAVPQPGAVERGWRDFFADECLQALIAQALAHNRDLRSAALRVQEAREQYRIQRADQVPGLSASGQFLRTQVPGTLSLGGESVLSVAVVGVTVPSYEVDFWGRVRSLKDAALAQYLASDESRRAFQISLVAQVADTYLTGRELDERIRLAADTLASREESYRIAQRRYALGATSELDMRQAETLMTTTRSDLAALRQQRAQTADALELLVGGPLPALPPPRALEDQGIALDLPAGLPSALLDNRPDLRAAEQRLRAAGADIGAARAAFFPRIVLTGTYGSASSELDHLFESGTGIWSFFPSVTLPIFDAGRTRANLGLARTRQQLALSDYESSIQQAFREVADALAARGYLAEQLDAQRATLAAQSARARLAGQRYDHGAATYLEVLEARRDLFAAQQSLVHTRSAQLVNAVALYRALGGGLSAAAATP